MSFYAVKPQAQALRRAATDVPGFFLERASDPFVIGLTAEQAAVADTDGVHAAATNYGTGPVTVNTGITNPPYPRNITATTGGTEADIKAGQLVVTGTNFRDEVITETLPAFTVDTATTVAGSKAFKTVTSYEVPDMDGNGASVEVGFGDICGLPFEVAETFVVIAAYLGGTREATLPAIVTDNNEIEKNTFDLSSALAGSAVELFAIIG